MIIDVHAHVVHGPEIGAYQSGLIASRGFHGRGVGIRTSEEQIRRHCDPHIASLTEVGTDVQLISPRPYTLMHSMNPPIIVQWYVEAVNDFIARQVEMYPDHYRGVCGLAQSPAVEPKLWMRELDRCVNEYGFVGCLLNPDPSEGQGSFPSLGDPVWYPVYERLCELNVPALVHGAGCVIDRESFHSHFISEESIAILSVLNSEVFKLFPDLKLIIAHGGGSVPYQVGRWRSQNKSFADPTTTFDEKLHKLYFDTALYNQEALDLELRICGTDRCLFGTERPGAGSQTDATGRTYDDIKPLIDAVPWLTPDDRELIYEGNARSIFKID